MEMDSKNTKEGEVTNSIKKAFFSRKAVVNPCRPHIQARLETLIRIKCVNPEDWYKDLGIDCGNASKIRRGLMLPKTHMRIRLAKYFDTDSATIWTSEDIIEMRIIAKKYYLWRLGAEDDT